MQGYLASGAAWLQSFPGEKRGFEDSEVRSPRLSARMKWNGVKEPVVIVDVIYNISHGFANQAAGH